MTLLVLFAAIIAIPCNLFVLFAKNSGKSYDLFIILKTFCILSLFFSLLVILAIFKYYIK